MKTLTCAIVVSLLAVLGFTSCETPGRTAMLGAGAGALIGNQSHTGPLRGAALGAGIGYLVGKLVEYDRRDRHYDDDDYEYRERRYSRYPVAERSGRRGFVISPYRPYNLIDVRGIPSGARVIDPSCGRIFINP